MTGELFRGFLKHKIYGTVVAVERDETGIVLAAMEVHEAIACRHRLAGYPLSPDVNVCAEINAHPRDFESFEPVCVDAAHLLADIGVAEKAAQAAEVDWQRAHAHAKALKETFEEQTAALRQIVRASTSPTTLPLFSDGAAPSA